MKIWILRAIVVQAVSVLRTIKKRVNDVEEFIGLTGVYDLSDTRKKDDEVVELK